MVTNLETDRLAMIWLGVIPLFLGSFGAAFFLDPDRDTVSQVENRRLAELPQPSLETLTDGVYTQRIEGYFADHFPLRDSWVEMAFWLKAHRGFGTDRPRFYGVADEGLGGLERGEPWMVAAAEGHDDPGESIALAAPEEAAPLGVSLGGTPIALADDAPAIPSAKPLSSGHKAHVRSGILIDNGRAMQMSGGNESTAQAYADAVNAYHAALGARVTVHALVVPTAISFYAPATYAKRAEAERAAIRLVADRFAPGVRYGDALATLQEHTDEEIYFRTDHHWTARGAYYAYVAFCRAAAIEALPLSRFDLRTKTGFVGTLYSVTQDASLREHPEVVEYFVPPIGYTAMRYENGRREGGTPAKFLEERSRGYGVFLAGDHPLLVARTDLHNGKRVLVVKNSYGNPFAVFMLPHFEEVYVVDYRYFPGGLLELIEKAGITDLVFMNVSMTAHSRFHRNRIVRIMGRSSAAVPAPPTSAPP